MTTWEYAQVRGGKEVRRLGTWLRPRARNLRHGLSLRWARLRTLLLPAAGASCFVVGAFGVSRLAGFVVAGLGCFFLEWRSSR